jgi:transcriptional regulator with XRE-family HTH domain
MKGRKKTPKVAGFMRQVLALNVKQLMDVHLRESGNKPMALAKAAGVSLSTVQRIVRSETGASLDNIEAIAAAFQLSAYQLLVPNLHPENPQVMHGATKDEERLYRRWKQTGTVGAETGRFAVLVGAHEALERRSSR